MYGTQSLFELSVAAILVALLVSLPALVTSLLVGFAASFFQGVTQVQDHTLTFVPRLLAVLLVLAWNFYDEIRRQLEAYGRAGGRFMLPVPEPRIDDGAPAPGKGSA